MPIVDVWAECHRLNRQEGWTQQRIAEAKGWHEKTVRYRVKWHESLPEVARKATVDGLLDEGHIEAISGVTVDVDGLQPWLTTSTAQTELTRDVLERHRGSSVGVKPTVAVVRKAANVQRRHLTPTQAAMHVEMNVELVERLGREARERQVRAAGETNEKLGRGDGERSAPRGANREDVAPEKATVAAAQISGAGSRTHERIRQARKAVGEDDAAREALDAALR